MYYMYAALECKNTMTCFSVESSIGFILLLYYNYMMFFSFLFFFNSIYVMFVCKM